MGADCHPCHRQRPVTLEGTGNLLTLPRALAWFLFSISPLIVCSQEGEEPFWECQVRFLTFLGVGHDSHTFAVIVDGGTQQFECHVFWCEPDAGNLSEAVQAACMVSSISRME